MILRLIFFYILFFQVLWHLFDIVFLGFVSFSWQKFEMKVAEDYL
jgi:hypothetical protein